MNTIGQEVVIDNVELDIYSFVALYLREIVQNGRDASKM